MTRQEARSIKTVSPGGPQRARVLYPERRSVVLSSLTHRSSPRGGATAIASWDASLTAPPTPASAVPAATEVGKSFSRHLTQRASSSTVLATLCYFTLCLSGVFSMDQVFSFYMPTMQPSVWRSTVNKWLKKWIDKKRFSSILPQPAGGYTRVDKLCSPTESYLQPREHVWNCQKT